MPPVGLPPRLQALVNAGQMSADQAHAQAMINDKTYAGMVNASNGAGLTGGNITSNPMQPIPPPQLSPSDAIARAQQMRPAFAPATDLPLPPGLSGPPSVGATIDGSSPNGMPGSGTGGAPMVDSGSGTGGPDIRLAIDQLKQKLGAPNGAQAAGTGIGGPDGIGPGGDPTGQMMTKPAMRTPPIMDRTQLPPPQRGPMGMHAMDPISIRPVPPQQAQPQPGGGGIRAKPMPTTRFPGRRAEGGNVYQKLVKDRLAR